MSAGSYPSPPSPGRPHPPRARAMASDARLSLPCRLPSLLPPPVLLRRSLPPPATAASNSPRCRVGAAVPARTRGRFRPRASASEGEVQQQQQVEDEVVDSNVLPYCSIDRKQKKTIGEMEQEFLQALQGVDAASGLLGGLSIGGTKVGPGVTPFSLQGRANFIR